MCRAGIDIPAGISPQTLYCNYMREKRKTEQLRYPFRHPGFQQRGEKKAIRIDKHYSSSAATAMCVFSAVHS